MTPILLPIAFLLVLDVLVLLGRSHDSRDGRDWQSRRSPSLVRRPLRPISRSDRCRVDPPRSSLFGRFVLGRRERITESWWH